MGKQKYTAKEKKVSRMTRNGLVEENLATKETKKFRREILPKKKRLQTVLRENEKHRDGTDTGTSLQVYLWIQR